MKRFLLVFGCFLLSSGASATEFVAVQEDLQAGIKESLKAAVPTIYANHRCGGLWDTQKHLRGILSGAYGVLSNPDTVVSQAANGDSIFRFDLQKGGRNSAAISLVVTASGDLKSIEKAEYSSESVIKRTGQTELKKYFCAERWGSW